MSLYVLHAVASLEPEAGSVAIALPGLFKALRAADIGCAVVSLDPTSADCAYADTECFESADLERLVAKADVLHLHGIDGRLTRRLVALARRHCRPYVISPLGGRSPNPYKPLRWGDRLVRALHDNRMLRGARTIAVLNDAEGGELRRQGCDGRIEVLPYGVDFAEYEEPVDMGQDGAEADDRRRVLMLGRIHPDEGLVPLLRAVAELGHDFRGWRLVIAGPERDRWLQQIRAAVERKGASDRIAFVVNPSLAMQRCLLSQASLVAAPALRVRCPISVEQAVATGVPVLASERCLPPGVEGGIRVCEPTRDALREALRNLIRLPKAEGIQRAAAARESGRRIFDWAYLSAKYLRVYEAATD